MLVSAHVQVFCICIFLSLLLTALQNISVGGTAAPRCPFISTPLIGLPVLPFFSLGHLDPSEEEGGDNQKVNVWRKQNC